MASRSSTNARNGAMPVPGPTMMIGVSPSSGSLKVLLMCTYTGMVSPSLTRSAV